MVVCDGLSLVKRDGEAIVAVTEGEAHALTERKPCTLQPDIGDLHPGHESTRRLHVTVVGFGTQRYLTGAIIASDADASNNSLTTGTLNYGEIENHAHYSASSMGGA